jgi:hypothetical protein
MAATDDTLMPQAGAICFFISGVDGYYGGVRDCNEYAPAFAHQG